MKFDQIAFRATSENNFDHTMKLAQDIYGLFPEGWVHDEVMAKGFVRMFGRVCVNKAHLAFNYSGTLEIEVIEYLGGANFHSYTPGCISHFGIHMDSKKEFDDQFHSLKTQWELYQHVTTVSHTNEYLLERKRTYEYAIFDTRPAIGHFTKLIRRIEGVVEIGGDG